MSGYLKHFGLTAKPFASTPDPIFAYATREHQLAVAKIQYAVEERQGIFLLQGEIGTGKCLGKGTPVLKADGAVVAVEALRVGDLLMGPDSQPRRILSLARGREPLLQVVPERGAPYVVNRSHILSLRYRGKAITRSVAHYLASSPTFQRDARGWRTGVDFPERPVPLAPYCLGLGLGSAPSPTGIPDDYRINGRTQRAALLAGLLDAAGSRPGRWRWRLALTGAGIVRDALFLARSLGIDAQADTDGIELRGDLSQLPIRTLALKPPGTPPRTDPLRTRIRLEPLGEGDYFGFELEGDGLFLLGDFTVTHNTTVSQFMLNSWRNDPALAVAHVTNPAVRTPSQFLRLVLSHYGIAPPYHLAGNWETLRTFLIDNHRQDKTTVLVIDEAQTISAENMETITHISNEQTQKHKLIQIVLLAQPNIARKLSYKPALRDRIAHGSTLNPLSYEDAVAMMRHRIQVAGADFDRLFPDEALHRRLYNITQGVPRRLCMLCDNALLNAYALRKSAVDDDALNGALDDLSFKGWKEPTGDKP
jgi:general secretion pathway protein A